ncbi:hypothetical protein C8R44DRAFT_754702 [Mycena epipterygia]|nr:hypothetical protein C8R44DRAFT_754702 [Mycena epipterygia]
MWAGMRRTVDNADGDPSLTLPLRVGFAAQLTENNLHLYIRHRGIFRLGRPTLRHPDGREVKEAVCLHSLKKLGDATGESENRYAPIHMITAFGIQCKFVVDNGHRTRRNELNIVTIGIRQWAVGSGQWAVGSGQAASDELNRGQLENANGDLNIE